MKARPNNLYRINVGFAYIDHLSQKGQAVGYILHGMEVFGPVSWNQYGICDLRRSRFNVEGGFCSGNNVVRKVNGPDLKAQAQPIKKLLEKL